MKRKALWLAHLLHLTENKEVRAYFGGTWTRLCSPYMPPTRWHPRDKPYPPDQRTPYGFTIEQETYP